MWRLLWIWLGPIKMRETLSLPIVKGCSKRQGTTNLSKSVSWILVTALLLYVHSVGGLLFIFLQSPTFILCGIYPPNTCLHHSCTLWMRVPGWTAVELLLEEWLLAALALHLHGDGAEGLVVVTLTQLVPPEQRDPRGTTELEGKCRQERWICSVLTAWAVCILLPSPREDEQLPRLVLQCDRVFLGHWGHLGKKNCSERELQHFQTLFRASQESKNGPSKTARSKEGVKKGGDPFLSAYKPQVFSCLSLLCPLSAACSGCGFNVAVSSIKQELPGIWD